MIPEPLNTYESEVLYEPIERLVEESSVASAQLKGEEKKRFGIGRPGAFATRVRQDSDLRPLVPCKREEPGAESRPTDRA